MDHPEDRKYTKDHEWIAVSGGVGTVGITHHAQDQLGDVVFVELPERGATVEAGGEFGTVESVKSVSELYSPVAGEIVAVNEALRDAPELVNRDPHGEGWMIKVKMADASQVLGLLDAGAYEELIGE
jgi:glycine cleavage system H protein